MDINTRLEISFYKTIATLNEDHQIYLVQHIESNKIYVKKILSVYNLSVYTKLKNNPIVGIPKIYCLHEEDNLLTLIEEYISGATIAELLEDGPFTEADTIEYSKQLCDILSQLYSFDPPIIHRDIKPSNIMVTPSKQVVLLDLNAARQDIGKDEDTMLLGTKGYAAPEQYGFGSSNIQTDIYSIGMLINTMLYGTFKHEIFPSKHLDPIIRRCTLMNPKDRYKTIADLEMALTNSKATTHGSTKLTWKQLLPPGYRTQTFWHMLVATPAYGLLIFSCVVSDLKGVDGIVENIEKVLIFLMFFSTISCATNYLNIQSLMPLCSHKNILVRLLGIIALSACFIFVTVFLMVIVELF